MYDDVCRFDHCDVSVKGAGGVGEKTQTSQTSWELLPRFDRGPSQVGGCRWPDIAEGGPPDKRSIGLLSYASQLVRPQTSLKWRNPTLVFSMSSSSSGKKCFSSDNTRPCKKICSLHMHDVDCDFVTSLMTLTRGMPGV